VVKVTGGSNKRVSLAAPIAINPRHRARLIYRVHKARHRGKDPRKGFIETGYARPLPPLSSPSSPSQYPDHRAGTRWTYRPLEVKSEADSSEPVRPPASLSASA
jgi:hypothetical protein